MEFSNNSVRTCKQHALMMQRLIVERICNVRDTPNILKYLRTGNKMRNVSACSGSSRYFCIEFGENSTVPMLPESLCPILSDNVDTMDSIYKVTIIQLSE